MINARSLRDRLEVFQRQEIVTPEGETDYTYGSRGKVWGLISVVSGRTQTLPGDTERIAATHKITMRMGACKLATDTYFTCQGLRYDMQYWMPHYKERGWAEVYCTLVTEDGT